jgi:hypothetical protein
MSSPIWRSLATAAHPTGTVAHGRNGPLRRSVSEGYLTTLISRRYLHPDGHARRVRKVLTADWTRSSPALNLRPVPHVFRLAGADGDHLELPRYQRITAAHALQVTLSSQILHRNRTASAMSLRRGRRGPRTQMFLLGDRIQTVVRRADYYDRILESLRKAGMPE